MAKLKLKDIDPGSVGEFTDKGEAIQLTVKYLQHIDNLLSLMMAERKHSLLIILQGIDAAGKDGTIRNIFTGANPQGVNVYSFKEPTREELAHDFLWRCHKVTPEAGMSAIFNRSYYEEVTTVMVHPKLLQKQFLPSSAAEKLFKHRYDQINNFEHMLCQNWTAPHKLETF